MFCYATILTYTLAKCVNRFVDASIEEEALNKFLIFRSLATIQSFIIIKDTFMQLFTLVHYVNGDL